MDKEGSAKDHEASEEDKPLKKARYMWEVKGKGYLKQGSDSGPLMAGASVSDTPSSSSRDRLPASVSGAGTPASASCCTQALLAEAQAIIDEYSSDEEENRAPSRSVSPRHPLDQNDRKQDYFLQKWQARQIARGFVDNTINSMLETWENRPFDASNFVDECENEGQVSLVEDDAILMAIQSHGLQSSWSNTSNSFNVSNLNSNSNSSFNSNISIAGSSRSESLTDTNVSVLQESSVENRENLQKEQEIQSSGTQSPSSMSANVYDQEMKDPMDFLNAAVSVAIQKKGLTYA